MALCLLSRVSGSKLKIAPTEMKCTHIKGCEAKFYSVIPTTAGALLLSRTEEQTPHPWPNRHSQRGAASGKPLQLALRTGMFDLAYVRQLAPGEPH